MKGLYKGFCQNENGKETIYLNGEAVKGDWVQGAYSEQYNENRELKSYILNSFYTCNGGEIIYNDEVIPETVCEAVRGLTDKNGRQVFEWDRVTASIYHDIGCYPHSSTEKFIVKIPEIYRKSIDGDIEVIGTKWDKGE